MRLQQWKANGWLQAHQTTPAQDEPVAGPEAGEKERPAAD
jgi:hypothetical protein